MRKILLSCSVVLLFACANEDGLENNSLDSGKGNNNTTIRARSVDFDLLFNNYVHSNSFINLNQKIKQFSVLLKYEGDLSLIDTNSKMFDWISANLDSTDFGSISNAVSKWEEIENLQEVDFIENASFYSQIRPNKNQFAELWLHHSIENIVTNNQPCKDQLIGCNTDAATQYADGMAGALQALEDGQVNSATCNKLMAQTRQIYDISLTLCKDQYEKCLFN